MLWVLWPRGGVGLQLKGRRLEALPGRLRIEVYDALRYFEQFGTTAQLPDVAPIVSLDDT